MVQVVASRDEAGRLAILAWNGTVDVTKAAGDPLLARRLTLGIEGLPGTAYAVRHRGLDVEHSNLVRAWNEIGGGADWPDDAQWDALAARDVLEDLEPTRTHAVDAGTLRLSLDLPMPAISLLELEPV
jgi:xylan 1,4-beta-xylosidase